MKGLLVKQMHIYTRNGDFGETTTLNGSKISKAHPRIELQGGIDEINSHIGYVRSQLGKDQKDQKNFQHVDIQLKELQYILFKLGTTITSDFTIKFIEQDHIKMLENHIDQMTDYTGKLDSFIYLSGHELATYCHITRSLVRRVERVFITYIKSQQADKLSPPKDNDKVIVPLEYKFINRLADYFFQLARYMNYLTGVDEERIQ